MAKILTVLFIISMLFCSQIAFSQEPFLRQMKFKLNKGFSEATSTINENNDNLDLMNYVYNYSLLLEDAYTGLSTHFWFRNGMEFNCQTLMQYHLNFKNIKATILYFPKKNLGINFGFHRYEISLIGFNDFPFSESDNSFILLNQGKGRQRLFDRVVYTGLVYRTGLNNFNLETKLNMGICSFTPFAMSIDLKQKESNLLRKIVYETKSKVNIVIFPELQIGYNFFTKGNYTFGCDFQANALFAMRATDYEKSTFNYTVDDYSKEQFQSSSHFYFKYETDLGVFVKF